MNNYIIALRLYVTNGMFSSIPKELSMSYALTLLKYLFAGFLISYYFTNSYSAVEMAITVLIADFKFFTDFYYYVIMLDEEEDPEEEDF